MQTEQATLHAYGNLQAFLLDDPGLLLALRLGLSQETMRAAPDTLPMVARALCLPHKHNLEKPESPCQLWRMM